MTGTPLILYGMASYLFLLPGLQPTSTFSAAVAWEIPTYSLRRQNSGESPSSIRTTPGRVSPCEAVRQPSALADLLAAKGGAIAQADLFLSEAAYLNQDSFGTRSAGSNQCDAGPEPHALWLVPGKVAAGRAVAEEDRVLWLASLVHRAIRCHALSVREA